MYEASKTGPDYEAFGESPRGLDNEDVRQGYVRKVFGILAVQFFALTAVLAITGNNLVRAEDPGDLGRSPVIGSLALFSWVLYLTPLFSFVCCPGVRKKEPLNHILFGFWTIALGMKAWLYCTLASAGSEFDVSAFLTITTGMTSLCCLGIFALSTFANHRLILSQQGFSIAFLSGVGFLTILMFVLPDDSYKECIGIGGFICLFLMAIAVYDINRTLERPGANADEFIMTAVELSLDLTSPIIRLLIIPCKQYAVVY